jgi:hypothetical protein
LPLFLIPLSGIGSNISRNSRKKVLTALEFLSHTHTHIYVLRIEQLTTKLFNMVHAVFHLKYVFDAFSLLCMIYIFRKEKIIVFNHFSALAEALYKFRPRRSIILTRYFVHGLESVTMTTISAAYFDYLLLRIYYLIYGV